MPGINCPTCNAKGRHIQPVTVESLAQDTVLGRLQSREGLCYCPTADCPVAWFNPKTKELVDKNELKVAVGMKETTDPRPICYCFGHDAAEFEADVHNLGFSNLPAEIAAKCKQGLDRCEVTNPQGSCCLGNANLVIQNARKKASQREPETQSFTIAPDTDCCSNQED